MQLTEIREALANVKPKKERISFKRYWWVLTLIVFMLASGLTYILLFDYGFIASFNSVPIEF